MADDHNSKTAQSNSMWGGQYEQGPAAIMTRINASIGVDKALYGQDIEGSMVHAAMLAQQEIITHDDAEQIISGLERVMMEIEAGEFNFSKELEDIHMNVEARLTEIIGDAAGRLHTGRSRNDQVATDLRLYVRDAIDAIDDVLHALQSVLVARAEQEAETVMPGFTHLQTAQPVTLGHHLLAYCEMISRDRGRFADCRARLNESPLGAAALAGTSFPLDRNMTARELGFNRPMGNSLDAVASRDYAVEFLSACSMCAMHLSRMGEELVLWSSALVGFIRFSDAFSTGSSIMPQKRNPDAAELVRGKAGRIFGGLMGMLVTLKALPLAYNKDMQEDKEPVFDAVANILLCLTAMEGMIADFTPDREKMKAAASGGFSTATDLADWLVRSLNMPFRKAHHTTARIVKIASEKGVLLDELSLEEMQQIEPDITNDIFTVLSVEMSVKSRTSYGGTAPDNVRAQAKLWKELLNARE